MTRPRPSNRLPLRLAAVFGLALLMGGLLHSIGQPLGAASWWWVVLAVGVAASSMVGTLAVTTPTQRSLAPSADPLLHTTTSNLPRVRSMRRLLKLLTRALVRTYRARHAIIYLDGPQPDTYWLAECYNAVLGPSVRQLHQSSPVIQWLLAHRQPLRYQDCPKFTQPNGQFNLSDPYARLHLIMDSLNAELIVPSFRGRRLLGFIGLGEKTNQRPYTHAEAATLMPLARQWAVALDNTRRFEDIQTTTHKLQSAQGRLVQQERMVAAGKLAMGLAHEIKNPLAGIKTFTEYLPERYNDPEFRKDFFEAVSKEVDRINRIVCSLADFAKPPLLKIETIDVQQVLKETVSFLSNDCFKKNVKLVQSLEPQPILLPGDASQLKEAFLNLCLNALDAMEKTGGTLSVSCQWVSGDAVIRIADTGTGITKEHLPQLFDPFFSTKQRGMGLGLAVVKQIVEHHIGSITVESEVGKGTSFEIRLPLAVRFHPHERGAAQQNGAAEAEIIHLAVPLDVVVVDDEPKMRQMLKEACEAIGCLVRVADSGEEALEVMADHVPQLLLLDLKLPGVDGFDVLKHLKLRAPQVAVLVITGFYDEGIDRYVREQGALACFHKPLDLPILQRKLAEIATQRVPQAAA